MNFPLLLGLLPAPVDPQAALDAGRTSLHRADNLGATLYLRSLSFSLRGPNILIRCCRSFSSKYLDFQLRPG